MIHFWLLSPAATHRHCRPYPILAKQVSGMRVDGVHVDGACRSLGLKKGMNHRPPLNLSIQSQSIQSFNHVTDLQFLKASYPTFTLFFELSITTSRYGQPSKTFLPIEVTLPGMLMLVKLLQK